MTDGSEPMPELDTLLREAAEDAGRRVRTPDYDALVGRARRRRTGRVAVAAGGLVAVVLTGMAVAAGTHLGPAPDSRPPATRAPATRAVVADPVLRALQTDLPILMFTPDPGTAIDRRAFQEAIFSALPGDRDFGQTEDIRRVFPDAPAAGPAILFDQPATPAQLAQVAANLRTVPGVRDARVVPVPGMWFTVSAARTRDEGPGNWTERTVDITGLRGVGGAAGSARRDDQGRIVRTVRVTYSGPGVTRAEYDLIRARVGAALDLDASEVTVTAAAVAGSPGPEPS